MRDMCAYEVTQRKLEEIKIAAGKIADNADNCCNRGDKWWAGQRDFAEAEIMKIFFPEITVDDLQAILQHAVRPVGCP